MIWETEKSVFVRYKVALDSKVVYTSFNIPYQIGDLIMTSEATCYINEV